MASMTEGPERESISHKQRLVEILAWLCRKYGKEGEPRVLPEGEDLDDYCAALADLSIEDLAGGARWHYGHSESYPDRPASLRRSAKEWRKANSRPYQPPQPMTVPVLEESPESREAGARALERVLDALAKGESPQVITVSELVGEV